MSWKTSISRLYIRLCTCSYTNSFNFQFEVRWKTTYARYREATQISVQGIKTVFSFNSNCRLDSLG